MDSGSNDRGWVVGYIITTNGSKPKPENGWIGIHEISKAEYYKEKQEALKKVKMFPE